MTGQVITTPPGAIRRISPKDFDSLFNGTEIVSNHTFNRVSFADNGLRLENRVFRYCTFKECDFIGKHIENVLFDSCDLRYAQFGAAEIVKSLYTYCQMNFTNFDAAVIRRTTFEYNNLFGVSLRNARVEDSWFDFCLMSSGNLNLGEFTQTFFRNVRISLDDFSGAKFDMIPGEIALEILWSKATASSVEVNFDAMLTPQEKEDTYGF